MSIEPNKNKRIILETVEPRKKSLKESLEDLETPKKEKKDLL